MVFPSIGNNLPQIQWPDSPCIRQNLDEAKQKIRAFLYKPIEFSLLLRKLEIIRIKITAFIRISKKIRHHLIVQKGSYDLIY